MVLREQRVTVRAGAEVVVAHPRRLPCAEKLDAAAALGEEVARDIEGVSAADDECVLEVHHPHVSNPAGVIVRLNQNSCLAVDVGVLIGPEGRAVQAEVLEDDCADSGRSFAHHDEGLAVSVGVLDPYVAGSRVDLVPR